MRILYAPINPSDLNMVLITLPFTIILLQESNCDKKKQPMQVEGVYGIKAKLPAVGGNEGVAIVEKVTI